MVNFEGDLFACHWDAVDILEIYIIAKVAYDVEYQEYSAGYKTLF